MSDFISRNEVLEAIDDTDSRKGFSSNFDRDNLRNYVKQMPSLCPEIIRCKDCKYHYKGICPIERYFSLDGFCSRGER